MGYFTISRFRMVAENGHQMVIQLVKTAGSQVATDLSIENLSWWMTASIHNSYPISIVS